LLTRLLSLWELLNKREAALTGGLGGASACSECVAAQRRQIARRPPPKRPNLSVQRVITQEMRPRRSERTSNPSPHQPLSRSVKACHSANQESKVIT
uniref:Uncharacterized protein n=1 Tax=Myripristis murdjan TaxID=586833 RepID=A0A668AQ07_9TELE